MDFYQFYDKINGGKPYSNGNSPVIPRFLDYVKGITSSSPVNGTETGTSEFRPITDEDMARYGSEDVVAYNQKYGKNTTRLGEPMTDEEYRKFMGITW